MRLAGWLSLLSRLSGQKIVIFQPLASIVVFSGLRSLSVDKIFLTREDFTELKQHACKSVPPCRCVKADAQGPAHTLCPQAMSFSRRKARAQQDQSLV